MIRASLVVVVFGVAACAVTSPPADDEPGSTDLPDEPAATDDPEAPSPPTGDRDIFDAMLRGEVSAVDGLNLIAASGGWPMRDGERHVFARLDDGAGPYRLAGDFNQWAPAEMIREAGVYWVSVAVEQADESGYKFVGPGDDYAADPLARRYRYDENGEVSLVGSSQGHLERWRQLTLAGIVNREVRVWVPSGAVTHHLYMHDGQNLFDPEASFGGWRVDASLSPGVLVVGIDNTPDRIHEYTHVADDFGSGMIGGGAEVYAELVEGVVRPHIETVYGEPEQVGVAGSSLGGLVSLYIAHQYPERYDFAASLSGTLGWGGFSNSGSTIIELYGDAGARGFTLYLDSGGHDGGGCIDTDDDGILDDSDHADNYCTTRQMADELAEAGYTWEDDLFHWWQPDAPHNEAAWRSRVGSAIQVFANQP